jgi:hypothetical protein
MDPVDWKVLARIDYAETKNSKRKFHLPNVSEGNSKRAIGKTRNVGIVSRFQTCENRTLDRANNSLQAISIDKNHPMILSLASSSALH